MEGSGFAHAALLMFSAERVLLLKLVSDSLEDTDQVIESCEEYIARVHDDLLSSVSSFRNFCIEVGKREHEEQLLLEHCKKFSLTSSQTRILEHLVRRCYRSETKRKELHGKLKESESFLSLHPKERFIALQKHFR